MEDKDIIKALECCKKDDCDNCPNGFGNCYANLAGCALDLINRQKAEIERLEYTLTGVMHSVDKWLDGSELKQGEVNRAVTMREKTLQIVERLEEENEFLSSFDVDKIRAEAIKEFAERLKQTAYTHSTIMGYQFPVVDVSEIDNLVEEMTEG